MKTVTVEILADTFVMGKDGHVAAKAGVKVSVPEADAAHLVAVGKAKPAEGNPSPHPSPLIR